MACSVPAAATKTAGKWILFESPICMRRSDAFGCFRQVCRLNSAPMFSEGPFCRGTAAAVAYKYGAAVHAGRRSCLIP